MKTKDGKGCSIFKKQRSYYNYNHIRYYAAYPLDIKHKETQNDPTELQLFAYRKMSQSYSSNERCS